MYIVVMCPVLNSPPNADVQHPNGVAYQSTAEYTCDNGYERSLGNLERTCGTDGTWSGSEPVCTGETIKRVKTICHMYVPTCKHLCMFTNSIVKNKFYRATVTLHTLFSQWFVKSQKVATICCHINATS